MAFSSTPLLSLTTQATEIVFLSPRRDTLAISEIEIVNAMDTARVCEEIAADDSRLSHRRLQHQPRCTAGVAVHPDALNANGEIRGRGCLAKRLLPNAYQAESPQWSALVQHMLAAFRWRLSTRVEGPKLNSQTTRQARDLAALPAGDDRNPKRAPHLHLRRAREIRTLSGGILVTIGVIGTACMAGAQEQLSLDQAVAEAVRNNAGLLAEKANIGIAEAKVLGARLRSNPVVSAGGDHLDALGTGFNEINGGGPAEYTLRMDFPIEAGGKRARRTEVAQLSRSVTELQFQNAVRSLAFEVANLFVDAQLDKESLALARENLTYFEGIVAVNVVRLRAGEIAEVELLRSRLASLQQRNVVREAESKWRAALIRLQTSMGRAEPSRPLELAGDLRRDSSVAGRDQWKRIALDSRPDLLALRKDLARSVAETSLQLAHAKVDPAIGTEYRRQQGVNGISNSMGVFLEVPLPVFNRNQGEIARARSEQRQALLRVRQLEIVIAGEVEVAHEQVLAADSLLRNIESEMLEQAQEVRKVTEFAYRRGHSTLLELLDAQRAHQETVHAYIEARAAYARSLYLLDSAAGRTVTQ